MSAPVVLLIVFVVAFAIAFAYRKVVEGSVDELVHVSDASGATITKQQSTAKQLDQLDKVVKLLGIVTVLYAVGLGCWMIMQAFNNGGLPS